MTFSSGFRSVGTRLCALVVGAFVGGVATAEPLLIIHDEPLDSAVVDIFAQGQSQRPLEQLTADERAFYLDQIASIFTLAGSERGQELANDPSVAAQIELSRASILFRAVATELHSTITITDEEIQAAYDQQIEMAPNLQYKARHILVATQAEAITLIEELIAGGNFGDLAMEHSQDSSAQGGGDLGWFTADQMVAPFSQAVAALEDGRYTTDPVQTQFGWHVILREESRPAEPPPLDSVRETIVAQLTQEKLFNMIEELKAVAVKPAQTPE